MRRIEKRDALGDRGIALFLVLWVLVLMSVIVGQFCYSMRTEVNVTRNLMDRTQAHYLAEAGIKRTIFELLTPSSALLKPKELGEEQETGTIPWRLNAEMPEITFQTGGFTVTVVDEAGKINLNTADEKLLKIMFGGFELDEETIAVLIDAILDWRDTDDLARINGAENAYYQELDNPYYCKNGNFSSIEELLFVRGMTLDLFYGGINTMVTVYPDEGVEPINPLKYVPKYKKPKAKKEDEEKQKININSASREMLSALLDRDGTLVESVLAFRKEKDFKSISEFKNLVGGGIYRKISEYISIKSSNVFEIRSTGMVNGSEAKASIRAVIELDEKQDRGYSVLMWKEG